MTTKNSMWGASNRKRERHLVRARRTALQTIAQDTIPAVEVGTSIVQPQQRTGTVRGILHQVSEAMLGHSIAKNQTVAAYLRTDYLDERRKVMRRWADFILSVAKPVPFHERGIRRFGCMAGG